MTPTMQVLSTKTATCVATTSVLFIVSIASAQATAFRGTHVGFNTISGQAGQQLQLQTGYGTTGAPESEQWAWRFQNGTAGGQLQTRTQRYADNPNASWDIASFNLFSDAPTTNSLLVGGGASAVAGWRATSSMTANPVTTRQTANFTGADAFVATGTLTGGSFAWEIMSVTALNGSSPASFAIGMVESTGTEPDANRRLLTQDAGFDVFGVYDASQSGGGSLADRSIFLGYGNHFHGWGYFINGLGTYEVTMRVYDVNNVYAASEALTFQVTSVPAPGAAALLALGGLAPKRRRR